MQCKLIQFFIFLILSAFASSIFADAMQERRIKISASIFPRIIAVDKKFSEKVDSSGNIKLGMIYHSDKEKALNISRIVTRKIKHISGNKIVFEYINMAETDFTVLGRMAGLFFVHPVPDTILKKLRQYSIKHNSILFSPFEGDIERGVMASIFVGAKIRPYFNLTSLAEANIKLKPALIKVSKTHE